MCYFVGANAERVDNPRGAGVRIALLLIDIITVVMCLVAVCSAVCKVADLAGRWMHSG